VKITLSARRHPPVTNECLSEAMSRRVYDLKNDEELKAAYWEAARGGAAGAAKVCTFLDFIVLENIQVFNRSCIFLTS
jgi:hypothetical protein